MRRLGPVMLMAVLTACGDPPPKPEKVDSVPPSEDEPEPVKPRLSSPARTERADTAPTEPGPGRGMHKAQRPPELATPPTFPSAEPVDVEPPTLESLASQDDRCPEGARKVLYILQKDQPTKADPYDVAMKRYGGESLGEGKSPRPMVALSAVVPEGVTEVELWPCQGPSIRASSLEDVLLIVTPVGFGKISKRSEVPKPLVRNLAAIVIPTD